MRYVEHLKEIYESYWRGVIPASTIYSRLDTLATMRIGKAKSPRTASKANPQQLPPRFTANLTAFLDGEYLYFASGDSMLLPIV